MSGGGHDVLQVSTADNVGIGYAVAGLGSRCIAQLVDGVIIGAILLVVSVLLTGLINPGNTQTTVLAAVAIGGVSLLVYVAYFAVCELATGGRTPGKSAARIQVIGADGSAPTTSQLLLRNVARIIDVLAGAGVVVMFVNRHSRRIGDLLAGTVVVHMRPATSWTAVVTPPPVMLRTPDAGPAIDGVDRLGAHELTAIRTFLSRPGLDPPLRARLAADMAARLLERMQLPAAAPERHWPAELLLERLYLQLQNRPTR